MEFDKPISPLSITTEQYARIQQAEAVVVANYTGSGGRFSKLIYVSTIEECEQHLNTPSLFLVFDGSEYLGSEVVLTSDLLPPDDPAAAAAKRADCCRDTRRAVEHGL